MRSSHSGDDTIQVRPTTIRQRGGKKEPVLYAARAPCAVAARAGWHMSAGTGKCLLKLSGPHNMALGRAIVSGNRITTINVKPSF